MSLQGIIEETKMKKLLGVSALMMMKILGMKGRDIWYEIFRKRGSFLFFHRMPKTLLQKELDS